MNAARILADTDTTVPVTRTPLIGWHEANRTVCFTDGNGTMHQDVPSAWLRHVGWAGEDADYRRCLPRIDPSPLELPLPPSTTPDGKMRPFGRPR